MWELIRKQKQAYKPKLAKITQFVGTTAIYEKVQYYFFKFWDKT
ncbi:hypothetical protein LEP1GSC109_0582 [Leptospira interrogans str. UI 13372]|nr:hypothetical protein LEP1GSC109_0582 [Leptospira interrogans str. UI 13372]